MNHDDLAELARSWEEVRDDFPSSDSAHDDVVRDCATRLAADPGGESAYIWTFGLVVMGPHLTWLPGEGLVREADAALQTADTALRERPCAHDAHPYEEHEADEDADLVELVRTLADETAEWDENAPREEWLCPCNVAGFARIAMDVIEPGSVTDVPPRLPVEAVREIETLSALLHGYPKPWTDIDDEISSQAWALEQAEPEDRPGRVMVVRAVNWYAVSGMVRTRSVLDDLVEALERTLPHLADATCDHDWHAGLPDSGPDAVDVGVMMSSPGGRALFARDHQRSGRGAPLDRVVCPVFAREVAEESLALVRRRREELFGERETAHLDAVYLLDDGRPDVGKIIERLDHKSWNEEYADDLALWAARRHEGITDERERAFLLVTAYQAVGNAYPGPVLATVRGVLAVMRSVAAAPRPDTCAHEDAHPTLHYAHFLHGLAHLAAPDAYPEHAEESRSPESWTCPRFTAEVAEECAKGLEELDEE